MALIFWFILFFFSLGQVHQSQYLTGPEIMFPTVIRFLLGNTGALSGAKMVNYSYAKMAPSHTLLQWFGMPITSSCTCEQGVWHSGSTNTESVFV
jgi:hypothetical protein